MDDLTGLYLMIIIVSIQVCLLSFSVSSLRKLIKENNND